MSAWQNELLHDSYQQSFLSDEMLFDSHSEHQHIQIFKNPLWGRIMLLDGIVQTTEKDEFIYHEMFAHVPCLTHESPKTVLIVGGGDGGLLREVLRHQCVERVVVVEIDADVVELCKTYLPKHSQGAWNDARVELVIAEGCEYVRTVSERFDLILSDSTDPVGPGTVLFSHQFYQNALNALTPTGILATQNGVSFLQLDELHQTYQRLSMCAQYCGFYAAVVPTYVGGAMHFAWASQGVDCRTITLETVQARFRASGLSTQYYSPEVHMAAFALPQYVVEALESDQQVASHA